MNSYEALVRKLKKFIRHFYFFKFLRGFFIFLIIFFSLSLFLSTIAYVVNLQAIDRKVLFFLCLFGFIFLSLIYVIIPLLRVLNILKHPNPEGIVEVLKKYLPSEEHHLLNILQLKIFLKDENKINLITAAIEQKTTKYKETSFTQSLNLKKQLKPILFLVLPLVVFFMGSFLVFPKLYTEGAERIIYFNREIIKEAPFSIKPEKLEYTLSQGEDLQIKAEVSGEEKPSEVFISNGTSSYKMLKKADGQTLYATIPNIVSSGEYYFLATGYKLEGFKVKVNPRAKILSLNALVKYPAYSGLPSQEIKNVSDITVLKGAQISWNFNTEDVDSLELFFGDKKYPVKIQKNKGLFSKQVLENQQYKIVAKNLFSSKEKADTLFYNIEVVDDAFPQIQVRNNTNTLEDKKIKTFINIFDDFGFKSLNFRYLITYSNVSGVDRKDFKSIKVDMNPRQREQALFFEMPLEKIGWSRGVNVQFFYEVFDNDAFAGYKKAETEIFSIHIASEKELNQQISQEAQNVSNSMGKALRITEDMSRKLQKIKSNILQKNSVSFEDKELFKELLDFQEKIKKELGKAKESLETKEKKEDELSENKEQKDAEKEAVENMLKKNETEKLKDLLEKLADLMDQTNRPPNSNNFKQIEKQVNQMQKDFERQMDMYKNMLFDESLKSAVENLEKIEKKQEDLLNAKKQKEDSKKEQGKEDGEKSSEAKTEKQEEKMSSAEKLEKTKQEQKEVKEKFENLAKKLEELNKLKEDINKPTAFENPKKETEDISDLLEQIEKQMEEQMVSEQKEQKQEQQEKEEGQQEEKQSSEEQSKSEESKESNNKQQEQKKQEQKQQNEEEIKEKQKKALEKMKKMKKMLEEAMKKDKLQKTKLSKRKLKMLLDSYLKASFIQEDLLDKSGESFSSEENYLDLVKKQRFLKDNLVYLRDSLYSLSKEIPTMKQDLLNQSENLIDEEQSIISTFESRNKKRLPVVQQYALKSINEITLLLSSIKLIEQMDQNNQSGGEGDNMMPSQSLKQMSKMTQMQKQLMENMRKAEDDLKKQDGKQQGQKSQQSGGQQSGGSMSEKMAKMAMQQQMIRETLQKLAKELGNKSSGGQGKSQERGQTQGENGQGGNKQGQGGDKESQQAGGEKKGEEKGKGGGLLDKNKLFQMMEETETDLLYKKINQRTILRQQEIMTRMLEFEKALREKEESFEFESKSAKEQYSVPDKVLEEYLKKKKKEVELIRTTPVNLNYFYKEKARLYFQKLFF